MTPVSPAAGRPVILSICDAALQRGDRELWSGLDLDVHATAQALEMTAVAVRVARHRALRRLRTHLAEPAVSTE